MGQNGRVTSLKEQLKADLTVSMKARQESVTSTLRMTLAAVMTAEVAGEAAKVLSDDQVLEVLRAEHKKRLESAEIYEGAGRTEAAVKERDEAAIIEKYSYGFFKRCPPLVDFAWTLCVQGTQALMCTLCVK